MNTYMRESGFPNRSGIFKCLLVYPEFVNSSFWNYRSTCELAGARYPAAPLGMMTVAALLPHDWEIKLIDCNVEPLTDEDIRSADLVMSGGMIAQQIEHLKLIERVRAAGKPHIVGGPDATSSPALYDGATALVLDEAELTMPGFLRDWERGDLRKIYRAEGKRADLSVSPVPRYDLIRFENYLHVGIQFSRGCPFSCEFCDIVELFGSFPRVKTSQQMISELQRLYALGYHGHIDIVDDNLIANRKALRSLLPLIKDWLASHDWPFEFSCEASLNLAEDPELLSLMQEVGFCFAFVGIETPNQATLLAVDKKQNVGKSIAQSIHAFYRHGIAVNAGYIIGFDSEVDTVADEIIRCIDETFVPANMIGLLYALPNTRLTKRLQIENRLLGGSGEAPEDAGDQCVTGLNFITRRSRTDIIDDFHKIIRQTFRPQSYFNRVLRLSLMLNCTRKKLKIPLRKQIKELRGLWRLIVRMGILASYRKHFWMTFARVASRNPAAIRYAVSLMALYLHFGKFQDTMILKSQALKRTPHRLLEEPGLPLLQEGFKPAINLPHSGGNMKKTGMIPTGIQGGLLILTLVFVIPPFLKQAQAGYAPLPSVGCPAKRLFNLDHFHELQELAGCKNPLSAGSERIFRGGAPTRDGVSCLSKLGVRAVFDLRTEDEMAQGRESQWCQENGIEYFPFPMTATSSLPSRLCRDQHLSATDCDMKTVQEAIKKMISYQQTNPNAQVFLHCVRGQDRTGLMIGLYRVLQEKCSKQSARSEMMEFKYNPYKPLEQTWELLTKSEP